jgi:hypothetical protein
VVEGALTRIPNEHFSSKFVTRYSIGMNEPSKSLLPYNAMLKGSFLEEFPAREVSFWKFLHPRHGTIIG